MPTPTHPTATPTTAPPINGLDADGPPPPALALGSTVGSALTRVVMQCDLDNLGVLLAQDEAGVVARWQAFAAQAERLIAATPGRLVRCSQDGLLAEFDQGRDAVVAAFALHPLMRKTARTLTQAGPMSLRIGLHATPAQGRDGSIGGLGMHLAARLAGLAAAGETIASAAVRDQLTEDLDATMDDLGDCFLKHQPEPVRAYRLGPPTRPCMDSTGPAGTADAMPPTIAIIPFSTRSKDTHFNAVGELMADRVIAQLGRSQHLNVITRLSGTAFRGRDRRTVDIGERLQARYVLTGSYRVVGQSQGGILSVRVQLTDTNTLTVVWEQDIRGSVGDLLSLESELVHALATGAHHAMLDAEVEATRQQPLQSLDHYALLLNGITLMHRSAGDAFQRSREALQELLRRDARLNVAHAWLAKWYVLRVTRGLTTDARHDATVALQHAADARATPGAEGLALAMEGFVNLHLLRDFEQARRLIGSALDINPNESLAWLFGGVAYSFLNQASAAQHASQKALSLSPLDPLLYYFESLAASSAIVARRYEDAIALCKRSLRRNVTHLHTHRALITACWAAGKPLQARTAAHQLLRLVPGYTVRAFDEISASANTEFGRLMSTAMAEAGVPLA